MKTFGTQHPTEVPATSDTIQQAVLAANVGAAFDTPPGGGIVAFGANGDFWVRWGSTAAAIPTTNSTGSSTNCELNPLSRNVGSTLNTTGYSIIAPSSGYVTASWYHV